jgi:hypothetical protein
VIVAQTYPVHPAAELFPMMTGQAYQEFKRLVITHGVRVPIVLLDGKLLDGRNRLRAANEAGKPCPTREATPDEAADPITFVMNENVHAHRHLSESQRALIAEKAREMFKEQAKEAQRAGAKTGADLTNGKRLSADLQKGVSTHTADKAAALLNVSPRLVATAAKVKKTAAPEIVEAVRHGDIALDAALVIAAAPADQQKKIAQMPEKERRAAVSKLRTDMRVKASGADPSLAPVPKAPRGVHSRRAPDAVGVPADIRRAGGGFSTTKSAINALTGAWREQKRLDLAAAAKALDAIAFRGLGLMDEVNAIADRVEAGAEREIETAPGISPTALRDEVSRLSLRYGRAGCRAIVTALVDKYGLSDKDAGDGDTMTLAAAGGAS